MTKNAEKKGAIIRCGDIVRIFVPELFIRCGYPKSVEAEADVVEKEFRTDILRMIGVSFAGLLRNDAKHYIRKVCREIAYARLKIHGFGGKERTIHTKTEDSIKGKKFVVSEINFCKTGIYVPPSGGRGYDGEYDYDPGCLDREKTHKILTLGSMVGNDKPGWELSSSELKIDAANVEKVIDHYVEPD